jgi:MoxR-like ATPase
LYRLCQAKAATEARDYVLPDDVKGLAVACLAHRIIVGPAARIKDVTQDEIVQSVLDKLPVPGAQVRR